MTVNLIINSIFTKQISSMIEKQSFKSSKFKTKNQCRDGPLQQRSCTNVCCCVLYVMLLITVIALAIVCTNNIKLTQEQVQQQLTKTSIGRPTLSIIYALPQIIISTAITVSLCIILCISAVLIPEVVTYLYLPFMLLLMLFLSFVFLFRFFGKSFPFVSEAKQQQYLQKDSLLAFGGGIIFLGAFLCAFITILCKKEKFKNINYILQISKLWFWSNCIVFVLPVFLALLSILFLYCNLIILGLSKQKHSQHIPQIIYDALEIFTIAQALWTHGLIQSLSDFLFQSLAIHWYFGYEKKNIDSQENKQEYGCLKSYSNSISLIIKHSGTIVYGSLYAYLPDSMNGWLRSIQNICPCFYSWCCIIHKCCCAKLSRYSYCQTILQDRQFCAANYQIYELKKRVKQRVPSLYLMGNFFNTIVKIITTIFGAVSCYILMLDSSVALFQKIPNLLGPLLVVFLSSLQISCHFTNCLGTVGDTLVFMYNVDEQIQKNYYGCTKPRSCPTDLLKIIQSIEEQYYIYEAQE